MDKIKMVAVPLGVILAVVLIIAHILLEGWVLSVLWGWFMEPVTGYHARVPWCVGLSVMVGLMTLQRRDPGGAKREIVYALLNPLFMLLIGWAVHLYL